MTKFWNCNLALGFASRCLPNASLSFPSLLCSTPSYPHSTRVMIARAQLPCFVLVWFIANLMAMTLALSLSPSLSLAVAAAQAGLPGRLVSGVCHLKSTFCFVSFRWKLRISIATSNMCVRVCVCVHWAYLLARFCGRPQRELTEFYICSKPEEEFISCTFWLYADIEIANWQSKLTMHLIRLD